MIGLTQAQAEVLAFIETEIGKRDGVAPSFEEIKQHCGLKSKSGVHRLVSALEERGRIRRLPNRARAIEIVPERPATDLEAYSSAALVAELARRSHEQPRKAA